MLPTKALAAVLPGQPSEASNRSVFCVLLFPGVGGSSSDSPMPALTLASMARVPPVVATPCAPIAALEATAQAVEPVAKTDAMAALMRDP